MTFLRARTNPRVHLVYIQDTLSPSVPGLTTQTYMFKMTCWQKTEQRLVLHCPRLCFASRQHCPSCAIADSPRNGIFTLVVTAYSSLTLTKKLSFSVSLLSTPLLCFLLFEICLCFFCFFFKITFSLSVILRVACLLQMSCLWRLCHDSRLTENALRCTRKDSLSSTSPPHPTPCLYVMYLHELPVSFRSSVV